MIFETIDVEHTSGDAVCIATGDFSGTWAIADVIDRIGISESHVIEISISVGHIHGHYSGTNIGEDHGSAGCIYYCKQLNLAKR